jgi:hypothetical protein
LKKKKVPADYGNKKDFEGASIGSIRTQAQLTRQAIGAMG